MGEQEVGVSAKGLCRGPTEVDWKSTLFLSSLVGQVKDSNLGFVSILQTMLPSLVLESFKGPSLQKDMDKPALLN